MDGMFYRSTGVGRVYESLLAALVDEPWVEQIETTVPSSERDRFLLRFAHRRVAPHFLPYGPMSMGDLFAKSYLLRRIAPRVSLLFFPGHNVPLLAPRPFVVGVNDVTVFSPAFTLSVPRKAVFRWLLASTIRRARRVVTISSVARGEILRLFPAADGKVEVLYPWVEDAFFEGARGNDPLVDRLLGGGGDFLLYLGLRIRHKNVDGLLSAFSVLAREFPHLRLVIAGRRYQDPDMVDEWKNSSPWRDRLVEIVDPEDQTIARLFARARAFVFPSLAEGFGLPPLEAMAAGVPVVCADLPVFREIYADAVRYVDGTRAESIAQGIRQVLADPVLAAEMSRKGRERAAFYRKGRIAAARLDLIRRLGGGAPGVG